MIKLSAWTLPLNYKGDHRDFDPNIVFGPNRSDEYYQPISATYDEANDRTTFHCALVMVGDRE